MNGKPGPVPGFFVSVDSHADAEFPQELVDANARTGGFRFGLLVKFVTNK